MSLTYAELCSGYGGLGLAVEEVFGAELAWYSEFDAAPSKIMAHHWPGVPNHGDMTVIDWGNVEPVDIISGGTPCQDLSAAGRRAGMTEGTRSNLWVQMREAIAAIKPTYVVWENVRGAYSAGADSEVEQCPGCMGEARPGEHFLRALGRVLGDLTDLGYDCQWRGLRAADVGAPHGRFRVFNVATRRDVVAHSDGGRNWRGSAQPGHGETPGANPPTDGTDHRPGRTWPAGSTATETGRRNRASVADASGERSWLHLPSGGQGREPAGTRGATLVPPGDGAPSAEGADTGDRQPSADPHGGDDAGRQQDQEWDALKRTAPKRSGGSDINWGTYGPAIRRWERTLGRAAPAPTEPTGKNGAQRLSPAFVEWMMGLPAGHVTNIDISRNEQLKALGNGVVPQQAAAALADMLGHQVGRIAA